MRNRQGYDKNHKDREKHDYYATPPEEVENILRHEVLYGDIIDPCCGEGHLIEPVKSRYTDNKVIATDLIDRGYGEVGLDFLNPNYPYKGAGTIIINPPFKYITEFVLKSLEIAKKKVVLLAQLQFLESQGRYENIFSKNKPQRIYIYVDRVACAINGEFDKAHDSSMTYSWVVWDNVDDTEGFYWIRRAEKVKESSGLFENT